MTPAGYSPAMRAVSPDASGWPVRTRTPPVRERSGNMWPGRARSCGRVAGSIAVSTVAARSAAEMPVLVRYFASIGMQNAVSNRELFWVTMSGISSSSSRSGVMDRQIRPRPWRAMKLIAAGVTFSAAIIRSPSFSRSASSTMMIILPSRTDSTASSMRANGVLSLAIARVVPCGVCPLPCALCPLPFISLVRGFAGPRARQRQPGQLRGADDVLANHIAFEVHAVADLHARQIRMLHGERDQLDVEPIDAQARDRQADAVHRNGSLMYKERRELRWKADREPMK